MESKLTTALEILNSVYKTEKGKMAQYLNELETVPKESKPALRQNISACRSNARQLTDAIGKITSVAMSLGQV